MNNLSSSKAFELQKGHKSIIKVVHTPYSRYSEGILTYVQTFFELTTFMIPVFLFSVVLQLLGKEWPAHSLKFPFGVSLKKESHTGLRTIFLGELLIKALTQQTTNRGDSPCYWAPSADRLKDEVKMNKNTSNNNCLISTNTFHP